MLLPIIQILVISEIDKGGFGKVCAIRKLRESKETLKTQKEAMNDRKLYIILVIMIAFSITYIICKKKCYPKISAFVDMKIR